MFKHCKYDKMFEENSIYHFNDKLNYDLEPFVVSDMPPNFKSLKSNSTCCWLNPCLSIMLILRNIISSIIFKSIESKDKKFKVIKNGFKKIINSKRQTGTKKISYGLNLCEYSSLYDVFYKIFSFIPSNFILEYLNIQFMINNFIKKIDHIKVQSLNGDIVSSIFSSIHSQSFIYVSKVLIIYNESEGYTREFCDFSIQCQKFQKNINGNYILVAMLVVNNKPMVICTHPKTGRWYETYDEYATVINEPINEYINSTNITIKILIYIVDIFIDEIMEL